MPDRSGWFSAEVGRGNSTGCALRDPVADLDGAYSYGRLSFGEFGGHRRLDRGGRVRVPEVIEQQRDRHDRRDRVGDALTGDVGRGTVHRLEHARVGPGDVEVAARRQPDTAGDGGTEVGEDVTEQVVGDD